MHLKPPLSARCTFCTFRAIRWSFFAPIPYAARRQYSLKARQRESQRALSDNVSILDEVGPIDDKKPRPRTSQSRKGSFGSKSVRLGPKALFEKATGLYQQFLHALKNNSNVSQVLDLEVTKERELRRYVNEYQEFIRKACESEIDGQHGQVFKRFYEVMQLAYQQNRLSQELEHSFVNYVMRKRISRDETQVQKRISDLRHPLEWYPSTRALQREIHLHVGPTNSGKTYHALQRLEKAETGLYAGPLRLLAHEVYSRFNAKGKTCALVTGEEKRVPEELKNYMTSCTVEMIPLNQTVDVAVIDEIQMIGDPHRGWAWTQALLGVKARELHLCGEQRVVPLIKSLCAMMGDKVIVHEYERLSPLYTLRKSLGGNLNKLEKGDCVIVFSRLGIHDMKRNIERQTGKRCAVVYGSLPPETRAQQASLFNDPDNDYDILVASDAVGMGLNLSIKRIIFEATSKFDGDSHRPLQVQEVKQIAGRAGRYRTATDDMKSASNDRAGTVLDDAPKRPEKTKSVGHVTTLDSFDLPHLQYCMTKVVAPLRAAGLHPPPAVIHKFAQRYPPSTPFSYILLRLHEICRTHDQFFMCNLKDQLAIADWIQPYNLTISDRIIFIGAPASHGDKDLEAATKAFARCIADGNGGNILEIPELNLGLLDDPHDAEHTLGSKAYLLKLESLHKSLVLYLWLSYRFAGAFTSQALAFHIKGLLEQRIDEVLDKVEFSAERRRKLLERRKRAVWEQMVRDGDVAMKDEEEGGGAVSSPFSFEDEDRQEPVLDGLEEEVFREEGEEEEEEAEEKGEEGPQEKSLGGEEESPEQESEEEARL